ncbi:MAG TPA: hypothetical protein VEB68_01880 [Croceibacterium sp.]|nr:hypothetical protein [Croceibacterium sp.]
MTRTRAFGGVAAGIVLAALAPSLPAAAQDAIELLEPAAADDDGEYRPPADLAAVPTMPSYKPRKTAWGDPDLRGGWPIDSLGGLALQRTAAQGTRVYLTPEEYAAVEARMKASQEAYAREDKEDRIGMGHWVEMTGAGRRTSLLIDPPDGRLPPLTEEGVRRASLMRSSWVPGQTFDWIDDFDTWDRCVTRGFPASMLPFRYNNGMRIFQSPGYVVVALEMIHDARVIPTDGSRPVHGNVAMWFGDSRGRWEGNVFVVETTNLKPGASALNMATIGVPPNNTLPMSDQATVVEKFALDGRDTLVYEMTYSDPVVWQAPFTVRMDIPRNDDYEFYEYACHEGDVQVRNYVTASRAQRRDEAARQRAAYEAGRTAAGGDR